MIGKLNMSLKSALANRYPRIFKLNTIGEYWIDERLANHKRRLLPRDTLTDCTTLGFVYLRTERIRTTDFNQRFRRWMQVIERPNRPRDEVFAWIIVQDRGWGAACVGLPHWCGVSL